MADDYTEPTLDAEDADEQDDTEDERKTLVLGMLEEAEQFYREEVEPVQAKATDYYLQRPFGNEEKGRSQVISTDVRDTVQAILPSMMRVFFGPERAVEFRPRGPEDVEGCEQKSDYVNLVFQEDNPGFMILHGWLKDGLVRKLGIVKYGYERKDKIITTDHSGLSEAEIAVLALEGDVTITAKYPQPTTDDPSAPLITYDVTLTRRDREGRIRIDNIPNDEFWFSPSARSIKEARLVAHVREMRADELIAMGIDADLVDECKGKGRSGPYDKLLANARSIDGGAQSDAEDEQDEETRPVEYAECYVLLDDEHGVELRKICIIGRTHIVSDEPAEERPFCVYCPDPEPHTIIGQSNADYTMDIQLIKSAIQRGLLDSLNLTLHPRMEIVEGQVNMDDAMNTEIGGLVRVYQPGMMRELKHDFVGREAMPVLMYWDETKENRTGISKAANGLDADALQSSTKAAVAATISAAQQHIEMLCRVFAETALKPLFQGLLRCVIKNQDYVRTVRLRNKFVAVDPRHWDANMDVVVNVALGAGTAEEKLRTLGAIAGSQMQLMAMPGQPLVGFAEMRNTLGRIAELSGWKNSNEFYKPFTAQQEEEQKQQQQQQQPPPDPTQQALEAQLEIEKGKLKLQMQVEKLKDDRERDKMAQDYQLKVMELEMTHNARISESEMKANIAQVRAEYDADLKAAAMEEQRMQRQQQEMQQGG